MAEVGSNTIILAARSYSQFAVGLWVQEGLDLCKNSLCKNSVSATSEEALLHPQRLHSNGSLAQGQE